MSKDNAYLWNKAGEPDPQLVSWEQRLSVFASDSGPVPLHLPEPVQHALPRYSWIKWGAALACLLIVLIAALRIAWQPGRSWKVIAISGFPIVDGKPVEINRHLSTGELLETDEHSRAMMRIGLMAKIEVAPATRLRFVGSPSGRQRLFLEAGKITARVWAPPFSLFVDTPATTAIDLGCSFTLQVRQGGSGELHVVSGWVASQRDSREAIAPAGAIVLFRPHFGPGTQFFEDASAGFRSDLESLDFTNDGYRNPQFIERLLSQARPRDAITLLGLLRRVDSSEKGPVFDKLAQFVAPPAGLTRDDVIRGANQHGIDEWWEKFGFGNVKSWLFNWHDVL
jgi:hypothetical protein